MFITSELAQEWGGPMTDAVDVKDINGRVTTARGGGPMYAFAESEDGEVARVRLAKKAYTSDQFDVNVWSPGAAQADGDWETNLQNGNPRLESNLTKEKVPIQKSDDNTWSLSFRVEPWHETVLRNGGLCGECAPGAGRVRDSPAPVMYASKATLNPNGKGARQPARSWTPLEPITKTQARAPSVEAVGEVAATAEERAVAAVEREAAAAARRTQLEKNYAYYHACFMHQDRLVDEAIKAGVVEAVKPLGWRCTACELAKVTANAYGSKGREVPQDAELRPMQMVTIDVYGPIKCGDRNGSLYIFAALCLACGVVFLQPMKAKSEAVEKLRMFNTWWKMKKIGVAVHLHCTESELDPGQLRSDRGGEFTAGWGATESEFDSEARKLFLERYFTSPGRPLSASVKVERYWRTMREAADASMIGSGLPAEFKFYAMLTAAYTYNRCPTDANKLGSGEAPFTTLGIVEGLQRIVPFGNHCVVKRESKEKGKLENVRGRVLGCAEDTPGYVVVLEDADGNITGKSEVIASVDVVPRRAGEAWEMGPSGDMERVPDQEINADYIPLLTQEEAAAVEAADVLAAGPGGVPVTAPVVQSVGTACGMAGSRAGLNEFTPPGAAKAKRRALLTKDEAVAAITAAAAAGQTLSFEKPCPKTGASMLRYEAYMGETTLAGLEEQRRKVLPSGKKVLKGGPFALSGDFMHDVRHHFVSFHAAVPMNSADGARDNAVPPDGSSPEVDATAGRATVTRTHGQWEPGLRRHVPANRAAVQKVVAGGLSLAERALLDEGRQWSGSGAAQSKRASGRVGDVPYMLVRAAVAETTGMATLEEVMDGGTNGVGVDHLLATDADTASKKEMPRSFKALRQQKDWHTAILPAIKKEIGGMIESNVYDEVVYKPGMGAVIPTHRLDSRKDDGTAKARLVAEGNRTTGYGKHFDEVATSMACQTGIKMTVAFAAGQGQEIFAIDFKQAFLQAPCENPNLLIELPWLPEEMQTGEYGVGRQAKNAPGPRMVGRLNKSLLA